MFDVQEQQFADQLTNYQHCCVVSVLVLILFWFTAHKQFRLPAIKITAANVNGYASLQDDSSYNRWITLAMLLLLTVASCFVGYFGSLCITGRARMNQMTELADAMAALTQNINQYHGAVDPGLTDIINCLASTAGVAVGSVRQ